VTRAVASAARAPGGTPHGSHPCAAIIRRELTEPTLTT
jgi:hypothetical protein